MRANRSAISVTHKAMGKKEGKMTNKKKPSKVVDLRRFLDQKLLQERLRQEMKEHSLEGVLGRLIATIEDLMFAFGEINGVKGKESEEQPEAKDWLWNTMNEAYEMCIDLTVVGLQSKIMDEDTLKEVADAERERRLKRWETDRWRLS
jgi:hypothetical protein